MTPDMADAHETARERDERDFLLGLGPEDARKWRVAQEVVARTVEFVRSATFPGETTSAHDPQTAQARDAAWMLGALDGTSGPRDRTHDDQETDMPLTPIQVITSQLENITDHLAEIRDRLPEREDAEECGCYTDDSACTKHDRPDTCCGKCPPIAGGGYDCTCEGNPRCEKADTPEEWHVEPAPADVDPNEALAMDLYHDSLLIPPVKEIGPTAWLSERDHEMWLGVARAAREHIEAERPPETDWEGIYLSERRKREKAEADLARVAEERDDAVKRVAVLDGIDFMISDHLSQGRQCVIRKNGVVISRSLLDEDAIMRAES